MILTNNKYFSSFDFSKKKKLFPFLFICDHATNIIPSKLNNLGLNKKQLLSHIGWDIGAKNMTLKLAKIFKCPCFFSNFSRLLIDPNRSRFSPDLMVDTQDGNIITGNQNVTIDGFKERYKYYIEYHKNLRRFIRCLLKRNQKLILISIHSFNQKCFKENRFIEIGLLYNFHNLNLALKILKKLEKFQVNLGNNYPYSGFFYNYTLDKHCNNNKIQNISIEIRNDLIVNKKGIDKWSKILKMSLSNYD
tara:strand:- start:334 stop:1077 length:744 start_codon:yes stop_codon:yes gene_type:complete